MRWAPPGGDQGPWPHHLPSQAGSPRWPHQAPRPLVVTQVRHTGGGSGASWWQAPLPARPHGIWSVSFLGRRAPCPVVGGSAGRRLRLLLSRKKSKTRRSQLWGLRPFPLSKVESSVSEPGDGPAAGAGELQPQGAEQELSDRRVARGHRGRAQHHTLGALSRGLWLLPRGPAVPTAPTVPRVPTAPTVPRGWVWPGGSCSAPGTSVVPLLLMWP